jgi:hypothetical protein
MEAICYSETSVGIQRSTRHYIPEESTIHNSRCENLKSYKSWKVYSALDNTSSKSFHCDLTSLFGLDVHLLSMNIL